MVANRIREFRKAQKLTLNQLADRVSADGAGRVHFTTIGKLERGEARLTIDWLARIAPALGVAVFELTNPEAGAGTGKLPVIVLAPGQVEAQEAIVLGYADPTPWSKQSFLLMTDQIEGADSLSSATDGPGWLLLIDPAVQQLVAGAIYLIMTADGVHRLRRFRETPPRFVYIDNKSDERDPILLGTNRIEVIGSATPKNHINLDEMDKISA